MLSDILCMGEPYESLCLFMFFPTTYSTSIMPQLMLYRIRTVRKLPDLAYNVPLITEENEESSMVRLIKLRLAA